MKNATQKFKEIERYLNETEATTLSFDNSPFASDVTVDYYFYPQDFLNDDEAQNSLKRAKFSDLYGPFEKLMQNADITPPSKEQFSGNCWTFTVIGVCVKPVIRLDMKKYLRLEDIAFICVPFEDETQNVSFKILIKSPTTGDFFVEMRDCKLLGENLNDEQEKKYVEVFIKAVNFIHERLNFSGSETINLSIDDALSEFARLAQMSAENEAEFIKRFFLAKNEPKKCAKILKERGFTWQGAVPSWDFLAYNFILQELKSFESHWKIDTSGLKKYINKTTGSELKIGKSEILEPYKIASKLEEISDYTLLNIEPEQNSLEGYCFFACKKEHKERILKLAEFLNLKICEF
ncbi:DUF7821 domain-containing protein [Campylobacter sp.]|uniref:DUF7821 domain-containing protein n=1 Tax=Campylobacter sp. TaxID=205 RepID=UPI0026F54088|nr:hypothetical protein [Campylobacter sp.]